MLLAHAAHVARACGTRSTCFLFEMGSLHSTGDGAVLVHKECRVRLLDWHHGRSNPPAYIFRPLSLPLPTLLLICPFLPTPCL